jgi:uncharacterized membrane protein YdbT with pleckstrin-like domain
MSYVKHVLQPTEEVLKTGRLHWIIYARAILSLLLALAAAVAFFDLDEYRLAALIVAAAFGLLAVVSGVHAWWKGFTTEIAVTTSRVIYKTGFITRHTAEMNMDKVESVVVDQSLAGRLFGYGTIDVRGTGVGMEILSKVADPIGLRNAIVAR